jgi:hypothetical protein
LVHCTALVMLMPNMSLSPDPPMNFVVRPVS